MDMNQIDNHARRVGKMANLVIFLGILGNVLSVLALTVSQGLARRGYGFGYITMGLLMMGLGYGIRYRYERCLYAALALFAVLAVNFLVKLCLYHTGYLTLRLALCAWVTYRLTQSVSPMRMLIAANAFPDRSNRFLALLLKRKHP